MNKNEIAKAAKEWYEQDESKRVVFHITAELDSDGDVDYSIGVGGEDTFSFVLRY